MPQCNGTVRQYERFNTTDNDSGHELSAQLQRGLSFTEFHSRPSRYGLENLHHARHSIMLFQWSRSEIDVGQTKKYQ